METKEFKKGDKVYFKTRKGEIEGIISGVDTNFCTFKREYDIDYKIEGSSRDWTMLGVPAIAIRLR